MNPAEALKNPRIMFDFCKSIASQPKPRMHIGKRYTVEETCTEDGNTVLRDDDGYYWEVPSMLLTPKDTERSGV
jgi:hypothetical protein